ncbi:ester cyclase [Flagellimonas zhangzhouensis]|uniref:SnoaL-like polyketide cyclase n=1 Tax=Flagellimonas zhangzhouensis TaxID=1073328 RepID=A0A1H2QLS0_9FLAO|nr:ester cyclase [Allomuricauda zhangzhouensis]SDQ54705.1 conserved hypothetical protein, steroid delta-isomerase-related [Allomuricauda zhangzhouensis]SDW08137.1 conserved hypothetical protein, steroid delta-isomerase-related [Allomuricauda zhangzhouensis]
MNKDVFLRAFMEEIWNKKRFEKVDQYIHAEYTIHLDPMDPWEGKTLSRSEFIQRMQVGSFGPFPDMSFEITTTIEDDHYVAANWILTGTNLGDMGEIPATNKKIETKGMTVYHFKDNLISGHTQIFDRKTVMKQLGFM